uniref:DUF3159 domain-containing protein n=1 Tax=Panagrellus redivivus TaxID=6233 RepID=A0A7E4W1B4_PANRE
MSSIESVCGSDEVSNISSIKKEKKDPDSELIKSILRIASDGAFHYEFYVEHGIRMACMLAATVVIGLHYPAALRFIVPYAVYTMMRIVGRGYKLESMVFHNLLLYIPSVFFMLFTAIDYCIRPAAKHTSALCQIGMFCTLMIAVFVHMFGLSMAYKGILGKKYRAELKKETLRNSKLFDRNCFIVLFFYSVTINLPWYVINIPMICNASKPLDGFTIPMVVLGLIPVFIGIACLVKSVFYRFRKPKTSPKSDEALLSNNGDNLESIV